MFRKNEQGYKMNNNKIAFLKGDKYVRYNLLLLCINNGLERMIGIKFRIIQSIIIQVGAKKKLKNSYIYYKQFAYYELIAYICIINLFVQVQIKNKEINDWLLLVVTALTNARAFCI